MKKKGLCYEKNIWQSAHNFNFYTNFKASQIKNILFYDLKASNIDKYIHHNYIIQATNLDQCQVMHCSVFSPHS